MDVLELGGPEIEPVTVKDCIPRATYVQRLGLGVYTALRVKSVVLCLMDLFLTGYFGSHNGADEVGSKAQHHNIQQILCHATGSSLNCYHYIDLLLFYHSHRVVSSQPVFGRLTLSEKDSTGMEEGGEREKGRRKIFPSAQVVLVPLTHPRGKHVCRHVAIRPSS